MARHIHTYRNKKGKFVRVKNENTVKKIVSEEDVHIGDHIEHPYSRCQEQASQGTENAMPPMDATLDLDVNDEAVTDTPVSFSLDPLDMLDVGENITIDNTETWKEGRRIVEIGLLAGLY